MKLELILLGKDMLGKILGKDIGFLKQFKKEGEAAAKTADKLNNARKKTASGFNPLFAIGGMKKTTAEIDKQARAQERLNNAIRREPRRSGRGRFQGGGFDDDLVQGGIGAGTLWASKKGMTSAMSKQEALTELYTSFYRSSLGAGELNKQMEQGEKIAERLGNRLPGTTKDFLLLFATMKQRGLEAQVILDGAGESAADLAVANKEDTQEVGVNVGRFGQMFDLKTRSEYLSATDLMSRAATTYGIKTDELMEAVKDFSGRTGKGLGLEGIKGAEDTLRYLSFLRAKTGIQGLMVGTSASSFFNQYLQAKQKKQDPTEELKKLTGVDLKIFDQKGKFLGLENAVKEFAKLRGKLSDEQMVEFGNKLAGEEGASIFQAMVKNGEQWDKFNEEMTNSISLTEKSKKNAENLTNKVEALTGSLSNLGSAGFTPLIKPIGAVSDATNSLVGYLTEMAKGRPILAGTTASVITLGGAYLALKGGSGVLSRITNLTAGIGTETDKTAKKVGKLRGSLGSISGVFKVLILLELAGATWDQIERMREAVNQWKKTSEGLDDAGKGSFNAYQQTPTVEKDPLREAQSMMQLLQAGSKQFEKSIDNSRKSWYDSYAETVGSLVTGTAQQGIYTTSGRKSSEEDNAAFRRLVEQYRSEPVPSMFRDYLDRATKTSIGAENIRNRAQSLADPSVMTAFRTQSLPGLNFSDEMKKHVENMLKMAFPQSFATSDAFLNRNNYPQIAEQATQLNQSFGSLVQPTATLSESFLGLDKNSGTAVTGMSNFTNAANSAANRLNNVQFTPPTFSPIRVPMFSQPQPFSMFGRARGGSVSRNRPYFVGENGTEMFVPSESGSIVSNDMLRGAARVNSGVQTVSFSPTVTVYADGGDPQEIADKVERTLAGFMSEFRDEFQSRNMARKVAFEADRDSERI